MEELHRNFMQEKENPTILRSCQNSIQSPQESDAVYKVGMPSTYVLEAEKEPEEGRGPQILQ